MDSKEKYVIIPAGGTGSRMGGEVPKQMRELDGIPILARTVRLFLDLPFKVNVIISINPSIKSLWTEYCRNTDLLRRYVLVDGGMTRFHSVKKALRFLPEGAIVAVHDAVRPLVPQELLISLFEQAEEHPAVVPVLHVADSMREIMPGGSFETVDRDRFRLVQTPQIFHSEVLKKAYSVAFDPLFTDDASVVEKNGTALHFHEGSRLNIKITTLEDMVLASAILRSAGQI